MSYDRHALETLKRADLQKLCKDQGIKANLKTEALIDLLLDTSQPNTRAAPEPAPKRTSSLRVVSRSTAASRTRGFSGSSMIIHDTDEEEEEEEEEVKVEAPASRPPSQAPPALATRTRKAKDTQYRLGVGRPALAGGSGARAVTKSVSVSKGKRGKASRSAKPAEEPIREEEEEGSEAPEPSMPAAPLAPEAGPSGTSHDPEPIPPDIVMAAIPLATPPAMPVTHEQMKSHMEQLMQPYRSQIELLQSQLERLSNRAADVDTLKAKVFALNDEVVKLRAQAARTTELEAESKKLRQSMTALSESFQSVTTLRSNPSSAKSAGKARAMDASPEREAASQGTSHSQQPDAQADVGFPAASVAATLLGKRHRDSDSQMTDSYEAGNNDQNGNDERASKITRPTKKRPRLMEQDPGNKAGSSQHNSPMMDDADNANQNDPEPAPPPRAAAFTVFSGPEESSYVDPPPPTAHLSDLFALPSGNTPPMDGGPATSTLHGQENMPNMPQINMFNFNFTDSMFQPVTSTPSAPYGLSLPSFSYPEPPTSPTPGAGPSGGYVERGGRRERNDLFHPFGAPRRPRSTAVEAANSSTANSGPSSRASLPRADAAGEGCVDPAALLHTPQTLCEDGAAVSSSEVGHRMGGMAGMASAAVPDTPAPPMKRTMYGTELEGDTRFGDFGLEGVATGFWTGTAPPFSSRD